MNSDYPYCLDSILMEFMPNSKKSSKIFNKKGKLTQYGYQQYDQLIDLFTILGGYFKTIKDLKRFINALHDIGIHDNMELPYDAISECDRILDERY